MTPSTAAVVEIKVGGTEQQQKKLQQLQWQRLPVAATPWACCIGNNNINKNFRSIVFDAKGKKMKRATTTKKNYRVMRLREQQGCAA